jgi:hypothetical protein
MKKFKFIKLIYCRILSLWHGLFSFFTFKGCCEIAATDGIEIFGIYIPLKYRYIGCTCGKVFLDTLEPNSKDRDILNHWIKK